MPWRHAIGHPRGAMPVRHAVARRHRSCRDAARFREGPSVVELARLLRVVVLDPVGLSLPQIGRLA